MGMSIALKEAKGELSSPLDGIQQSKHYAVMLYVPFAHSVEEFNFFTKRQSSISTFPNPSDCKSASTLSMGSIVNPLL